jgi:cytochrome c5
MGPERELERDGEYREIPMRCLLLFTPLITFLLAGLDAALAAERGGDEVFKTTCTVCHATGVSGAPRFGSKDDWKPRIAQGKQILYQHVLKGYKAMPAKGTCATCSDQEIKRAVDYMVSHAK